MSLTHEEKQEALDLAKGMLLAQKDSLSLAGNIINNPHFSSIPHRVKLEALRNYSELENEGEYRDTVNVEPDRAGMAKSIAKAALRDGTLALPLAAVLAASGAGELSKAKGRMNYGDAIYGSPKASARFMRKIGPLGAALFASNALVGGIRESINQKGNLDRARLANQYLDRIRGNMSDAEVNAMLFGSETLNSQISKNIKRRNEEVDVMSTLNPNVISMQDLMSPGKSKPAQFINSIALEGEDEINSFQKQADEYGLKLPKPPKSYKPPKIKLDSSPLRNTNSTPGFSSEAAKIRSKQNNEFSQSMSQGSTGSGDTDAQLRTAKAAMKKLLRMP